MTTDPGLSFILIALFTLWIWILLYTFKAIRDITIAIHRAHFFFPHATCESTCDTLPLSAANLSDNIVSADQGGTTTPGTTKQLLPPDRVFKRNINLSIYTPDQLKADITLDVRSSSV